MTAIRSQKGSGARSTPSRTVVGGDDEARPRRRGLDATAVLTVYLVLLCAIPSGLTFTALGSVGHPATLWALGAALWWGGSQVLRNVPEQTGVQPLRMAFFIFAAVALISYAWAMTRGIPSDEVLTATSGLVTIASWAGILLVANDGIATLARLRTLLRRIVTIGALLGLLGLLQFVTKRSLIDWISLPLMTLNSPDISGLAARSGFVRASGTASHPLEYAVILCVALPIAIVMAFGNPKASLLRRWIPVLVLAAAAAISVSRSTLIGAAVAVIAILPTVSARARLLLISGAALLLIGVGIVIPGMFGTIVSLFSGLSSNPSILSRTTGISLIVGFVSHSPVLGRSYSTFLPSYYIFDDAYLLMSTELGIVGLLAFLALIVVALVVALRSKRLLRSRHDRQLAQALVASLIATSVLFAFFDGLSFPQAAGIFFLIIGMAGSLRRLAIRERQDHPELD